MVGALLRILLILSPFILYYLWLRYLKKRAAAAEDATAEIEAAQSDFARALGLLAAFLAAIFLYLALSTGEDPKKAYVPPHLENGQVVPGEFHDKDAPGS